MKSSFFYAIVTTLFFVGVLAGYTFWYALVADESVQAADLSQKIADETKGTARAASARAASALLVNNESMLEGYFVSESTIVSFIENLQALGKGLGTKVDVRSVSANGPSHSIAIQLHLNGSFDSVMRTIGAIEYAPYAITVLSVALTHGSAWDADFSASVGGVSASSTPHSP